jgi:type VI secretion system protein ImpA
MADGSIDWDGLLVSFGEDAPSGEDPEYSVTFSELQIAATPKEEQQVGDAIIEGAAADFGEMERLALEVLSSAHDLRAAIMLADAQLNLYGFGPFAQTLSYMKRCLEEFWGSCHPQLDADDDNDPTMRINAVAGLVDPDTLLKSVRQAPLTDSRGFGRVSMRDILISRGELPATGDFIDSGSISAAFQDTDTDKLDEISDAVGQAIEAADGIANAFFNTLGFGNGPELDPLLDLLRGAQNTIAAHRSEDGGEADGLDLGGDAAPASGAAPSAAPMPGGGGGAIRTSADVIAALDRICEYYARSEPSSPVPMLLKRAKKLVSADFMTIIEDMASDSLREVRKIGGIEDDGY